MSWMRLQNIYTDLDSFVDYASTAHDSLLAFLTKTHLDTSFLHYF